MKSVLLFGQANRLVLEQDEIHIWSLSLAQSPESVHVFYKMLDGHERQRAFQFRFARDRERFVSARGLIKQVLSLYIQQEPEHISFSNINGKPQLPGEMRFNYSHSHELVVFAIAKDREVGIDVEKIRRIGDEQSIANAMFSPAEAAELCASPLESRAEVFFTFWTRKEAYVKARGDGLGIPLDSFDVCTDRVVDGRAPEISLHSFHLPGDHIAAVAAQGVGWKLTFIASGLTSVLQRSSCLTQDLTYST